MYPPIPRWLLWMEQALPLLPSSLPQAAGRPGKAGKRLLATLVLPLAAVPFALTAPYVAVSPSRPKSSRQQQPDRLSFACVSARLSAYLHR